MKKFDESMVGKKVRFISEESHEDAPEFYPPVGTIGEVVKETPYNYRVKWPKSSGVGKDCGDGKEYSWFCLKSNVEPVEDSVSHMTDAEVFKMLEPKLEKNSLNSPEDFEKAVALIYRIGYGRGQKGRPFEYQNTKSIQKEEDKLVGKKVVLVNPDEMDVAHGFRKGMIGTINGSFPNSDFIYVTFNYHSDAFHKSKIMLIVDDEPKKGDKVVFLDEDSFDRNSRYCPPVGTILEYCGDGWYYTTETWASMNGFWKDSMERNHKEHNTGISYIGYSIKKVIPLC